MQIEVYKNTNKYYEDEFEKPIETKEIKLQIEGVLLDITEHQYGTSCKPYVHVTFDGTTYSMSMDFDTFIKSATLYNIKI